jgi:hypothetical protein
MDVIDSLENIFEDTVRWVCINSDDKGALIPSSFNQISFFSDQKTGFYLNWCPGNIVRTAEELRVSLHKIAIQEAKKRKDLPATP